MIRPLGRADVADCAALWTALYRAAEPVESGSEGALSPDGIEASTLGWAGAAARGEDSFGFVAVERGVYLGFIAYAIWDRSWSLQGRIGNINALWVEPHARRLGWGRRLADRAIADMRRRRVAVIELQAMVTNPGAQAFWSCVGFEPKATVLRLG